MLENCCPLGTPRARTGIETDAEVQALMIHGKNIYQYFVTHVRTVTAFKAEFT